MHPRATKKSVQRVLSALIPAKFNQ
jgi:hypothetical protein